MEAICSSETFVHMYQTTLRDRIPYAYIRYVLIYHQHKFDARYAIMILATAGGRYVRRQFIINYVAQWAVSVTSLKAARPSFLSQRSSAAQKPYSPMYLVTNVETR
jgi:hypothetical protein